MLQTINGIDLALSLVILTLGFIVSIQKDMLKQVRKERDLLKPPF